jgi:hypothetical protein
VRAGQRGRLTGVPTLDGARVEAVRVRSASVTVQMLGPWGAYASGDELVVNHYEFVADAPPTHGDYADEAESAQRGRAWPQAAALWRRAAATCDDAQRRAVYELAAAKCDQRSAAEP